MELKQSKSLGPQVYTLLREQIIQGLIEPGTRLSEQEISRLFNVSRQPVREAFIKLRNENLVEIRPQRGTFVSRIRIDAVNDARFIREAVEADIIRVLVERSDAGMIKKLRKMIEAQQGVVAKINKANDANGVVESSMVEEFYKLDEQFHRSLAEFAGKNTVWEVIADMKVHFDRVRYLSSVTKPLDKLIDQHEAVVDAIAEKDAAKANEAIRYHLQEVLRDLPVVVSRLPDFFTGTGQVHEIGAGSSKG